jgi:hypothetical protein
MLTLPFGVTPDESSFPFLTWMPKYNRCWVGDLGRPPDRGQAYSRRPVSNPPLRYLGLAPFLRAA